MSILCSNDGFNASVFFSLKIAMFVFFSLKHCFFLFSLGYDNVYVLLSGRKRFRLYAPSDAVNLYTMGTVTSIDSLGNIHYKEHTNTNHFCYVSGDANSAQNRKNYPLYKKA